MLQNFTERLRPSPAGYQAQQDHVPGQDIPVVVAGVERGRIAVTDILP